MKLSLPFLGGRLSSFTAKARDAAASKLEAMAQLIVPTGKDRWQTTSGARISPKAVAAILRDALSGELLAQHELFELMEESWDRLRKNMHELRLGAAAAKWTVQPYTVDEKAPTSSALEKADFLKQAIDGWRADPTMSESNFRDTIYSLSDSIGRGLTVQEILWEVRGGFILPRATQGIHPFHFGYPMSEYRLRLRPDGPGTEWMDVPENKFLIGVHRSKFGHAVSQGFLRPLAWWWAARTFGRDWLLNYAQLFGNPLRWATYDPNASQQLKSDIAAMLERMGSTAWAAFPNGTDVKLVETNKAGDNNPQSYLIDLADKSCDILLLGQTLTTDVGSSGSRALGDVHMSVRDQRIAELAQWNADLLNNQFVPALLRLNYGDITEAPKLIADSSTPEGPLSLAQRDSIMLQSGVDLPAKWFFQRHGIPEPQPGEPVIKGQVKVAPIDPNSNQGESDPMKAYTAKQVQVIRAALPKLMEDRLTRAVLEDVVPVAAEWLAPIRPVFVDLTRKALDKSITDEDFHKALAKAAEEYPSLFDKMNVDALQAAMERAMGSAVVNGAVRRDAKR